MNRFKQIVSRGWLGNALSVFTFGYYPTISIQGRLCAVISMSIPGASFAMSTPSASFDLSAPSASFVLSAPSATVSISTPGATIEMEDCD